MTTPCPRDFFKLNGHFQLNQSSAARACNNSLMLAQSPAAAAASGADLFPKVPLSNVHCTSQRRFDISRAAPRRGKDQYCDAALAACIHIRTLGQQEFGDGLLATPDRFHQRRQPLAGKLVAAYVGNGVLHCVQVPAHDRVAEGLPEIGR